MIVSISILSLVAVLAITLFITVMNLIYWSTRRGDQTALWLSGWLLVSAAYAFFRIVQFSPISEPMYIVVPRILMTAAYSLAWLGYELGNSFIGFRPPRWERVLVLSLVVVPITMVWATNLIFTDQPIIRTIPFGGSAHGAVCGKLFVPISLLILGLAAIPPLRLIRAETRYKRENILMAVGFLFVILFNLFDVIAIALNVAWIRLADFSYLPVALFFSYIQVSRYSLFYQDMSAMVDERTVVLSQVVETLRASERKFSNAFRISPDSININRLSDGKYIEVNEGFTRLTGFTAEDVKDKTSLDINIWADPADRARLVQGLREQGEVINLEASFRLKDGQIKAGLMSARIIQLDGENCILSITRDISALKQAEEEIRRSASEMTALYEITHDLVIEKNLSKLLHTIVERAAGLLNASGGGLYLCEPEQRLVRCVVSYQTVHDFAGTVLKYGEGAAGLVAETGEALIIDDYRVWRGRAATYEEDQPFISVLSVPMLWQEKVIGVIHLLENASAGKFTPKDLRVLTLFANQAAIAVENARLLEFEQRRHQEAAAIAEVGRDISASLELDIVLDRIASHAQELLNAETSAVYITEPSKTTLRAIAAYGPDAEAIKHDPLQIGEGILGDIAVRKTGEIVNDNATDARAITIKGTDDISFEHIMGVPILSKDRLTGLIAVWRIGIGEEFKSADLDFLTRLAQQAAIAIVNARLFEETQKRLREMEAIAHVSADLSRTLELEPLLETLLQTIIRAIPPAERGSILLADEDENLRISAVWGYQDPRVRNLIFSPNSGYATVAFQELRAIVIPDVCAEPRIRYKGDISEILTGGSAIAAPLIVKGRAIGVIAIDVPVRRDAFNNDDMHLLETLASSAALAIENSRLFEDTRRRLAELEILQTIASALRIAQNLDEVFPIILAQLINLLDVGSALVDLIDPDSGEIVSILAQGVWTPMVGMRTPIDRGGSGRVIASGIPYVTNDVLADGVVAYPDMIGGLNAAACVPIVAQHLPIGTLWVGRRSQTAITSEEVDLLVALGEMVGNTVQRMKLHEQTVQQAEEIASAYDLTLEGWAKALELRDKETEGHSRRVTELTLRLAEMFNVPEHELIHIRRGVLLHDIGKMGVPDQILKNAGPLNEDEWGEMRRHPQYAYDLIYPIVYLRPALDIPYCHHEKWDGSGYPRGLKGEQIPLAARIFAVVDVYDALTCDRPYRAAWTKTEALDYLREQSGKHFDPKVVEAFFSASIKI